MVQQVNLLDPILLAPRRLFSARTMLQATALLAAALVVAGIWVHWSTAALRRELEVSLHAQSAQRDPLSRAVAAQSDRSSSALDQEVAQLQQTMPRRRQLLAELLRGRAAEGSSHAVRLRMIASTLPPSAWLSDLRFAERRVEISGFTLQPDALPRWLMQLRDDPLLDGKALAIVKVQRVGAAELSGGVPAGVDVWTFRVVNDPPESPRAPASGGAS